jgi:hypothetical protein
MLAIEILLELILHLSIQYASITDSRFRDVKACHRNTALEAIGSVRKFTRNDCSSTVIGFYLRILSRRAKSGDPYPHLSSQDKQSYCVAHGGTSHFSLLLHLQSLALRNAVHLAHVRGRLRGVSVAVAAQRISEQVGALVLRISDLVHHAGRILGSRWAS